MSGNEPYVCTFFSFYGPHHWSFTTKQRGVVIPPYLILGLATLPDGHGVFERHEIALKNKHLPTFALCSHLAVHIL